MGPSRLRDQVQMLVDHDSNHLNQIVSLRERISEGSPLPGELSENPPHPKARRGKNIRLPSPRRGRGVEGEGSPMNAQARLQATLHSEIPLSQAIGIAVHSYDDGCLALRAPLAPNINHKDTAFAGSLNALVTLTGWSLIWLLLDAEALRGKIVIQDSTIRYLRPVTQDFVARASLPPAEEIARFLLLLREKDARGSS